MTRIHGNVMIAKVLPTGGLLANAGDSLTLHFLVILCDFVSALGWTSCAIQEGQCLAETTDFQIVVAFDALISGVMCWVESIGFGPGQALSVLAFFGSSFHGIFLKHHMEFLLRPNEELFLC